MSTTQNPPPELNDFVNIRGRPAMSLRILISKELPDTRIFVDKLFHEYIASGRRLQTERLVQNKDRLPWLPATQEADDS